MPAILVMDALCSPGWGRQGRGRFPMFRFLRHFPAVLTLTSFLILANPDQVFAGWMGFRNDTQMTLMIQETVTSGKTTRAGKPQKVFANETVRDSVASTGNRTYTIF